MLVQTGSEDAAHAFVQTVRQNYEGYTKKEILRAKEARRAMGLVGYPNEQDFKGMVRANMIPNCPIDVNDIANARDIWGPDLASIRGKMVTTNTSTSGGGVCGSAKVDDHRNKTVTLAADVIFVDGTGFLMTVLRNIKFITA